MTMCFLAYVFFSLAFYRFMKSRNLKRAFLAWVPFASSYVIGKVYDDINNNQSQKNNFSNILDNLGFGVFLIIFVPVVPILLKIVIVLSLYSSLVHKELRCYELIFKKYAPNNPNYLLFTKIFMTMPIVPFIPSLCLLKASNNQPVSGTTDN